MAELTASCAVSRFTSASAFCLIGVALSIAAGQAAAQAVTFLNPAPGADGKIAYAVGPEVDVRLAFTAEEKSALELRVLPFVGEQAGALSLTPSIEERPDVNAVGQGLAFTMDQKILTLRLKGPGLPTAAKYTGAVAVLLKGKPLQITQIVLNRAQVPVPAKVTIDPKAISVYQTVSAANATFKVQALNTSREWQAEGLFLRLLEVTPPPGRNFDAGANLKLTWNGKETGDLWRSPDESSRRSIPPNRQAEIGGELVGVEPGEYAVKVGLGASNATVEGDQTIAIKLYVRHHIGWAIGVLLLAIIVSWLATKGLEAQRKRATQLKKIADIPQDSLRGEPAPLPAVAARAILKQAEDRNRSWVGALFGQDTTGDKIDRAELLVKILGRVRGIESRIGSAPWSPLIRNRANKVLARITASLNPGTVDADAVKKLDADLDGLEKWFDSKQFEEQYWLNLKREMEGLASYVDPANFSHHAAFVTKLRDAIVAAIGGSPPTGLKLAQVEETYAKLKILWERNQDGDSPTLKALGDTLNTNQNMGIEEFFRQADAAAWSGLENAKFEFTAPVANAVDPQRAYQLIRFEIAPENRRLGNNYLFKHKVEYLWTLKVTKKRWLGNPKSLHLTQARTNEPRVVQYVPYEGTLDVSVSLHYSTDTASVPAKSKQPIKLESLQIARSREYGFQTAFRMNEVIAVGIAAAAALLSGLMTYYLNKPGFGSLADYVTLFIWGAGADQTKNFIQNLERVSGSKP